MSVYFVSRDTVRTRDKVSFWLSHPVTSHDSWWTRGAAANYLGDMSALGFSAIFGWLPELAADESLGELWRVDGDEQRERLWPKEKDQAAVGGEEVMEHSERGPSIDERLRALERKVKCMGLGGHNFKFIKPVLGPNAFGSKDLFLYECACGARCQLTEPELTRGQREVLWEMQRMEVLDSCIDLGQ